MANYETDSESGVVSVSSGEYVTCSAIVLREILIESLSDAPVATEFVAQLSDAVHEDEDGVVSVQAFDMLDTIAEHISWEALETWLNDPVPRAAIADLCKSAFGA
jgi:hypothetical protein